MKEFKDKVAVVTGAGSGMGRAMAVRFAREGMRVVLADVEEPALAETQIDAEGVAARTWAAMASLTSRPPSRRRRPIRPCATGGRSRCPK